MLTWGTHGRKGVAAHAFLGQRGRGGGPPCAPARLVRHPRTRRFPTMAWPAARRLQLLVPVDGSPAAEAALTWVMQLRRTVPCDVTLLQPLLATPREPTAWVLWPMPGCAGNQPPELLPLPGARAAAAGWASSRPRAELRCRSGSCARARARTWPPPPPTPPPPPPRGPPPPPAPPPPPRGPTRRSCCSRIWWWRDCQRRGGAGGGVFTALGAAGGAHARWSACPQPERSACPDTRVPRVAVGAGGNRSLRLRLTRWCRRAYALLRRHRRSMVEICHVVRRRPPS
jgi:hypothetical protein